MIELESLQIDCEQELLVSELLSAIENATKRGYRTSEMVICYDDRGCGLYTKEIARPILERLFDCLDKDEEAQRLLKKYEDKFGDIIEEEMLQR